MFSDVKNLGINLMFFSWLFIDTMNGLLSHFGLNFAVSIFFKILFLLYMLKCLVLDKGNIFFLSYIIALLALSLTTVLFSSDSIYLGTFIKSIKVVGVIIVIHYVMTYSYKLDVKQVRVVVSFALVVILCNVLLGHLGYGVPQYAREEGGVGTRGFFVSGNELNFTFIMITFIFLRIMYLESLARFVLSAFGLLIIAVLIGSKTPILGVLLAFVLIGFNKLKSILMMSLFFCSFAFLSYLYIPIVNSSVNVVIDLFLHNISRHPNLLDAITSGRLGRIIVMLEQCTNNFSCLIIGNGIGNISESDFFDLFYWYGLIYTILILLFYFNVLATAIFHHTIWLTVLFVVFGITLFAGHAVYSMMAAPFLALAITVPRWCKCEANLNKFEEIK